MKILPTILTEQEARDLTMHLKKAYVLLRTAHASGNSKSGTVSSNIKETLVSFGIDPEEKEDES